jgi:hypothetical protein
MREMRAFEPASEHLKRSRIFTGSARILEGERTQIGRGVANGS